MNLHQIVMAIPGKSLADISSELDEHPAANLLASWTALWDPALLVETRSIPAARPAGEVLEIGANRKGLVVVPSIVEVDTAEDWPNNEPLVACFPTFARRREVIAGLAERLSLKHPLGSAAAADFYAFGFAYLQIELLTRSVHYDPQAAQESLESAVVAAADAALAGDKTAVSSHLEHAYDHLMQSRNHYYPIDFYLVDLMLTAPSVAGWHLAEACRASNQSNVLVTGELLSHLVEQEPGSLEALSQAWRDDRILVCGGAMTGDPLDRLSPEGLLAELRAGGTLIEKHLGRRPTVFAHPAGPLAPLVPGVLHKLGYHSAVLNNFTGGTLPGNYSGRTTWTGLDNTPIEAIAAEPIDVGSNSAMLALAKRLQHTMNYDLAASILLAGWPGHRTEWHADLMQVAKRSSVLGRPITLDEYFEVTTSHDYTDATRADSYPAPTAEIYDVDDGKECLSALALIAGAEAETADAIAKLLTTDSGGMTDGTLWLNASSVARPRRDGNLPAFGWRYEPRSNASEHPPRCEPGILRNEHMEVVFDRVTGGISATRLHAHRGNYLSQHLVVEPVGPQGVASSPQLAFDGWQVVESIDTTGMLVSDYRVVDRDGKTLANVRQFTSLAQHQRSLGITVEFEPLADRAKSCRVTSRIAVRDEGFSLTRGLQGVDLPTSRSQVTAAWVGIVGEPLPIAVLCDVPRRHRRHSGRMLDTRLVEAAGENSVVDLSYVLDGRYPAQEFAAWRQPRFIEFMPSPVVRQPSGWWLHLGARNVLVTHLAAKPLDDDLLLHIRLLETAGRPVSTQLSAWRPIAEARQVNFLGEPDQLLHVADGNVKLSLAAYEFVEVEVIVGGGQ